MYNLIPLSDRSELNEPIIQWNEMIGQIATMKFNHDEFVKLFHENQNRSLTSRCKYGLQKHDFSKYFMDVIYDRFAQQGYYIPYSQYYFSAKYVLRFDMGTYSHRASIDFKEDIIQQHHQAILAERKRNMDQFLLYQNRLSKLATKGFEDLTDEEKRYWLNRY